MPLLPALHSRRHVALLLIAAPGFARAADAGCAPVVLFVCPAGTVKSAIAREELRRRAAQARMAVDARSRGLDPEDHVSPALAARLRADGIDPASEPARRLTAADIAAADIVVAFDDAADRPELKGARAWRTPSWNADYDSAKADLATRLDALLAELRASRSGCRPGR